MLSINPIIYEQIATTLLDQIASQEFYTGEVNHLTPDVDYSLSSTLIIRYKPISYPEATEIEIAEVIPIWWEMTTTIDDGQVLNDFDFNLLKRNICN